MTAQEEISRYARLMRAGGRRCFVFGSNLAGRHGAGAARAALEKYGAVYGVGVGRMGRGLATCYAIPTKDERLVTLPEYIVRTYVNDFKRYAADNPDVVFVLTRVGCVLAEIDEVIMREMFQGCPSNVIKPEQWEGQESLTL